MGVKFKKYIQLAVVFSLFLILIIVSIWLVTGLRGLYRLGELKPVNPLRHNLYDAGKPILRPVQIEGWMTFRYLNYIFNLPADYLSSKLGIVDLNYPNFALDKYINAHKLDSAAFIGLVKEAVSAYSRGGNL